MSKIYNFIFLKKSYYILLFFLFVFFYNSIDVVNSQQQEQSRKEQSINQNTKKNISAQNVILNSNIPDLNFVDRIAFVIFCKINILFQRDSTKCFININKIVSDTVKQTPQNNDNYNMLLTMNSSLENLKLDFARLKKDLETLSKSPVASSTVSKNNNTINNTGLNIYNNYSIMQNLNVITASGYFTKNKSTRFEIYDKDIFAGNIVALKKNDIPQLGQIVKLKDAKDFLGVASKQNSKIFDVIISGRAEVEVTAENGAVKVGDYITLSNTFEGVGMKMSNKGQSLGVALSDDVGTGKVLMLIRPQIIE